MTEIHKVLRSIASAQKDKPQPLYFVKVGVCCYLIALTDLKLLMFFNAVL